MSVYVRYVLTDARAVTLGELERALRRAGPGYRIDDGVVRLGEVEIAAVDVTLRGDPVCDGDLDLLARQAERTRGDEVRAAVRNATGLVCAQLLNTLDARAGEALAPLWEWLVANREGLLAREGGRFFDRTGELT